MVLLETDFGNCELILRVATSNPLEMKLIDKKGNQASIFYLSFIEATSDMIVMLFSMKNIKQYRGEIKNDCLEYNYNEGRYTFLVENELNSFVCLGVTIEQIKEVLRIMQMYVELDEEIDRYLQIKQ